MIKFFRKIRLNLLLEGSTGKYFNRVKEEAIQLIRQIDAQLENTSDKNKLA